MLRRRCLLSLSAAVAGIGLGRRHAAADDGGSLVCGFGAGNPSDLCAQLIHDGWSANLGQPVTFDYTIGEAGLLAAREVVASNPDGKTILLGEILNLVLHDARGADLLPRL